MSNDAGGYGPPPGYGTPAYGAPPAYGPPGYGPPPGYYGPPPGFAPPPPGYPGYPPPGYPPQPGFGGFTPPALKPGIIPLRPLTLSDVFNGAFAYVRANPKATLGLTAIVVVVAQLISLLLQVGPIAAVSSVDYAEQSTDMEIATVVGLALSTTLGALTTVLSAIVLSGLLTVVIGRAVFGADISIGDAWRRVRGRLLALFGIVGIEVLGATLIIGLVIGIIAMVAYIIGGVAAVVLGIPLGLAAIAALFYLGTILLFAPTLAVLERLPVMASIRRSIALVKKDFWRVLGIWLLGQLVAAIIAGAVSIPFSIGGQLFLGTDPSASGTVLALVLLSIGSAIGQIVTAPFTAGVVVLLYADRRIRAEAFDLVLQTGVGIPPYAPSDSTDHLWLTSQTPQR